VTTGPSAPTETIYPIGAAARSSITAAASNKNKCAGARYRVGEAVIGIPIA
jgi:hypothetical protein